MVKKIIISLLSVLILISGLSFTPSYGQDNTSALINKAVDFLKLGDVENAIPLLKQVLENDPDNIIALKNLSVAYYRMEMCEDAIVLYDKILSITPNNSEILFAKAVCYNALGIPNEALSVLDQISKKDSKNPSVLLTRANSLVLLGEYETAKNYYDEILRSNPNDETANFNKLLLTKHLKDHDLASNLLVKILGYDVKRTSEICDSKGCMGGIPFLLPMKDSTKYSGFVQIQVRNSSGDLVAVVESDTITYTPHPVMDQVFERFDITRMIDHDGQVLEIGKITEQFNPKINPYFMDRVGFFHTDYLVLFAYNLAIPIESGDSVTAEWTIEKRV